MPRKDGTGPRGQGQRNGIGFGVCGKTAVGGGDRRKGSGGVQAKSPRCRRRARGGSGNGMRGGTQAGSAGAPVRSAWPGWKDTAEGP